MRKLLFGTSLIALACVAIAWTISSTEESKGDFRNQTGLAIVVGEFPEEAVEFDGQEVKLPIIKPNKDGEYPVTFKIVYMMKFPGDPVKEEKRAVRTVEKIFPHYETNVYNHLTLKYYKTYCVMEIREKNGNYIGLDDYLLPELPKLATAFKGVTPK